MQIPVKKKLLIITGLPCSGKSTLSRYISQKTNVPCFDMDLFKFPIHGKNKKHVESMYYGNFVSLLREINKTNVDFFIMENTLFIHDFVVDILNNANKNLGDLYEVFIFEIKLSLIDWDKRLDKVKRTFKVSNEDFYKNFISYKRDNSTLTLDGMRVLKVNAFNILEKIGGK